MAWQDSLQEARFRGIVFDVIRGDDDIGRATAEHAYPYLDGAEIEDMGRNARRISLDAVFLGDDYEARLENFLKALHEPGPGELIHPVFGSFNVQLAGCRVHHEADNVDQAGVALEFIETLASRPFFNREVAPQTVARIGQCGTSAQAAAASALDGAVGRLRAGSPLAALNDLRQAMLGPILAGLSAVNGVLTSGLDVLTFPRAWANDLSAIVNGVLDVRDFGSRLLADWTSAGRVFGLFDVFGHRGVTVEPIRPGITPSEVQATAAVQAHIEIATAIGMASAAELVLAAEAELPTLSPPEIEAIANSARSRIEACLVAVRAVYPLETARTITEPLKDQALALQEAARVIIESRPPLLDRAAPVTGNLRLQAHAWYGNHARAPELYRLNPGLRQPNFIVQGDVLHAFAR